eukprot:TRINITY_DN7937_c0_g1_i1.p1 TRINITY_DN7937_c0_g1~~TRINITY_DN7937_c0_g1_i1.p1  ORF type:complete len:216 (+),score=8.92 TRINITY_DN7937_c0_g1_i1:634-1281(+)
MLTKSSPIVTYHTEFTLSDHIASLPQSQSLPQWLLFKDQITTQTRLLCNQVQKSPMILLDEAGTIKKHFSMLIRKKIGWDRGKELLSKFITRYINKQAASSIIRSYESPDGSTLFDQTAIEKVITSQFRSLYQAVHTSSVYNFPPSTSSLPKSVIDRLSPLVTLEEIITAISQMDPSSVPGPDSLTAALYQIDPQRFASFPLPPYSALIPLLPKT